MSNSMTYGDIQKTTPEVKEIMGRFIDLSNKQFGRLFVIERSNNDKQGKPMWKCRCDCGGYVVVRGAALVSKHTVSCGCYNREVHQSHGGEGTRLYRVWNSMKGRCLNRSHKSYPAYGGRGITICDDWLDFGRFREWALGAGYDEIAPKWACTIDRIDVDKGYYPKNCRWVDMKKQGSNKRNNLSIEHNGVKHTLREWSEILGVGYQTLYARVTRYGCSLEGTASTGRGNMT